MQIDFYYWEGCPSHEDALARLRAVMAAMNVTAPVSVIEIQTEGDAQEHQFIGSPTIRVNGVDVDPPPPDMPYALNCRVYRHEETGRFSPLPSEAMIRKLLSGD